ncbi:MAG: efflux RND transporter periplasmic adaptor subunit [Acidobacteriota bacterium]|nr:efflux RND transporter periplasmic adaptor subunit [Acidobacteriota bacterium]
MDKHERAHEDGAGLFAPEDQIVNLETGQIVRVDLPVLRRYDLTGRITSASAGSIGSGRLFPVVIELSDVRDAIPGLTAEVVLPASSRRAAAVLLEAVINPTGREAYVFVIRDGWSHRVPFSLGPLLDRDVVLNRGPEIGERVVIEGQWPSQRVNRIAGPGYSHRGSPLDEHHGYSVGSDRGLYRSAGCSVQHCSICHVRRDSALDVHCRAGDCTQPFGR